MRILVTGGMGHVGRPTVQWLLDKGHEVRVLDLSCESPIEGAECFTGSIADYEGLHQYMEGMEGVIHLAAYPAPGTAPEIPLFHTNVEGTFNIYRAAADAGIKRVVCASSINALGYNFGIKFPKGQLRYFPIDEEHPSYTTDPYSFSKQMIEEIGQYFWRREGISSLFLRLPAVYNPLASGRRADMMKVFVQQCHIQTTKVMNMAEPQRSEIMQDLIKQHAAMASARMWEVRFDRRGDPDDATRFENFAVMFGRTNFWTLLDARDAAQAAEKGLLADFEGSYPVYVNEDQNLVGISSRKLVELCFPEVTTWKRPVSGTESLVSINRVKELIGFEVNYPYQPE